MAPTATAAPRAAKRADTAAATAAPEPKVARRFSINIYHAWCKSCGICVEFCPKDVLVSDAFGTPDAVAPEKCIGCTLCVLHCPDFAITVSEQL